MQPYARLRGDSRSGRRWRWAATAARSRRWPPSWPASWRTVNGAVMARGRALLAADCARVGDLSALGLDQTLFGRCVRLSTRVWCTSIVGVAGGQLRDIVAGRAAAAPTAWLLEQPEEWHQGVAWGVGPLRRPPQRLRHGPARRRAGRGPLHVVRLANDGVDETRRRVPNDTLGHRGRKGDPLYRTVLVFAPVIMTGTVHRPMELTDPRGDVRLA